MSEEFQESLSPSDPNANEFVECGVYAGGVGFRIRSQDVDRLLRIYRRLRSELGGEPGYSMGPAYGKR